MQGFTLLELVVVVALLGMIASLAADFTIFNNNQDRFDVTKTKLDSIHRAILGVPGSTINGEVNISGFVADTGTIPAHLIALVLDSYCVNPKFLRNETDCENNNAGDWESYPNWSGPYLYGLEVEQGEFDDSTVVSYLTFRDGWGNNASRWLNMSNDEELAEDILNFGWWVRVSGSDLIVRSVGLNGAMDPGFVGSSLPGADPLEASTGNHNDFESLMPYEGDYPVTSYIVSGGVSDFTLELLKFVNNSEVTQILKQKSIVPDIVYLRAVNISGSINTHSYCLVISEGGNTYISDSLTLNLEANQAETLSFSNFMTNSASTSVSVNPIPKGNYTYELHNICPAAGSAIVPGSSFKVYIKNNGDFATLYEFI